MIREIDRFRMPRRFRLLRRLLGGLDAIDGFTPIVDLRQRIPPNWLASCGPKH